MWMIAVILVFLWLLAFKNRCGMDGFIHVLLAVAALAVLIGMNQGRDMFGAAEYDQPDRRLRGGNR